MRGLLTLIDNPIYNHRPHRKHQHQPSTSLPHEHHQHDQKKQDGHHQHHHHPHKSKSMTQGWRAMWGRVRSKYRQLDKRLDECIEQLPDGVRLALVILKNPMLWSIFIALIVSCSGLRIFLDPDSPDYSLEVGWITNTLKIIAGTTVPLSLFNNGIWLYGKQFWKGNIKRFFAAMFIKIVILPFLQLACAKAVRLPVPAGMSLVVLSICPVSAMSFVVSSQYNYGADIVTMVTVVGTMLLVPLVLAALNIPKEWGLYDYDVSRFPLE